MFEEKEDRPSYVRFERRAIEDPVASREAGHYVAKDIDYVLVTPAYSKDIWENKVSTWMDNLKYEHSQNRISREQLDLYKKAYEAWKNGQELPLNGCPIRGWGMISPAQQETLIRMHILTVEQLAAITAEGTNRIGIGALDMKNKAEAWLKQTKSKGSATLEITELKKENRQLKKTVESLEKKIEQLSHMVRTNEPVGIDEPSLIDDILEDDAA
jgi:FtsZ-binding cell division protein ZapB